MARRDGPGRGPGGPGYGGRRAHRPGGGRGLCRCRGHPADGGARRRTTRRPGFPRLRGPAVDRRRAGRRVCGRLADVVCRMGRTVVAGLGLAGLVLGKPSAGGSLAGRAGRPWMGLGRILAGKPLSVIRPLPCGDRSLDQPGLVRTSSLAGRDLASQPSWTGWVYWSAEATGLVGRNVLVGPLDGGTGHCNGLGGVPTGSLRPVGHVAHRLSGRHAGRGSEGDGPRGPGLRVALDEPDPLDLHGGLPDVFDGGSP
jgi:hypothetical protein